MRERGALGVARQCLRKVAGRTDQLARQFGVAPVYLAIGIASCRPVRAKPFWQKRLRKN